MRKTLGIQLHGLTLRTGGGGGYKSTIYFADTDHGSLVIRVPRPGTGWSAPLVGCQEYHCLAGTYTINRLASLGQPVPEVIAIEHGSGIMGGPFAVFRRVPGVHMQDWSDEWTIWPYPEEQWGGFLGACHSLEPVCGAGPVDDKGLGYFTSWSDFLSRLLTARAQEFSDLLPVDFGARMAVMVAHLQPQLDARPVQLLHLESCGFCNLILDPKRHTIVGVLDYEDVTAGDPLYEMVVMGWYLGRRGICDHGGHPHFNWRQFYKGYGTVDWRHPLIPVYTCAILLEKLWRRDEAAYQRVQRVVRVLQRLEHHKFNDKEPKCR